MRRSIAMLVLWIGLLGAGSPAFACATAAAGGDCCPPGTASGCSQTYEQLDVEATVCCITAAAPSQIVAVERSREADLVQRDGGSAEPIVAAAALRSFADLRQRLCFEAPASRLVHTDASLTYLRTGRLRL